MKIKQKVLWLLPLFLALPLSASARNCTGIGCENGLFVRVPLNYAWKPGKYQFSFQLDQQKISCSGQLPLRPCEEATIRCDKKGVLITESGCALPKEAHGFGDILIPSLPKSVQILVSRNGSVLGSVKANPKYSTTQPNGPDCEPICTQSTIELPLK